MVWGLLKGFWIFLFFFLKGNLLVSWEGLVVVGGGGDGFTFVGGVFLFWFQRGKKKWFQILMDD